MSSRYLSPLARGAAGVLLGLALGAACSSEGGRPREPESSTTQQPGESTSSTASTDPDPAQQPAEQQPTNETAADLDAGTTQSQLVLDAWIPTSEYVRGWDAAAAEAERGFAAEDAGPDAN